MREELIISGRNNPAIDPSLHIWHWEIPTYLFLGGLAAGILFFAAFFTIRNKENDYPAATKIAPFVVPFALIIGLLALFLDLRHKLFFWKLYTTIRFESPMSWGAWTLMLVTPVSFIWCGINLRKVFPKFNWNNFIIKRFFPLAFKKTKCEPNNWEWRFKFLGTIENWFAWHRKTVAWVMIISSIILGIYTGILLSAFNARPLWNTSILGPLFLASGLSAGAALILLLSKDSIERKVFARIDLMLIGIELFLIVHMFMGFLASTQVQIEAAHLFLGGDYTLVFWIFVVFLGLLLPAFLEILELKGRHIPAYIPPMLVLLGGIILRFVIVYAGQASRYLY